MNRTIPRSGRSLACAFASALFAASLTTSPAAAQSWPGALPAPVAPSAVSDQIAAQPLVRVAGPWGNAILHRPQLVDQALSYEALSEYTPSSADTPAPAQPLALNQVAVIERPVSASRTGVVVGAALGGAAGFALGVGLAQSSTGPAASFNTGGEVLGGGLAGGILGCAVGGVLGAIVGSRIPGWQVMYRRPS